jgi:hypothetical protein
MILKLTFLIEAKKNSSLVIQACDYFFFYYFLMNKRRMLVLFLIPHFYEFRKMDFDDNKESNKIF